MKRNIFNFLAFALVGMFALTSCEMDQYPEQNVTPDRTWSSITDLEAYRMGLYSSLRSISGGSYDVIPDAMTDEIMPTYNNSAQGINSLRWNFSNTNIDDQPAFWSAGYSLVAQCNNILQNIDKVEVAEKAVAEQKQIKGETYLMRALAYHRVATYFCKAYDPATAAQTPGLPLVTELDRDAKPARASLFDTYKLIKADIDSARKYMTDNDATPYLQDPTVIPYMLKNVVIDAFEARVDLWMKDYDDAIQKSLAVINNPNYRLLTTTDELKNMWTNDEGSEILFQIYQSKDERGKAPGASFLGYNVSFSDQVEVPVYVPNFVPTQEVMSAFYDYGDIRYDATFTQQYVYDRGYLRSATLINKFPGNPALVKSRGDEYNMAKLFRLPEAYLIAAESYYNKGDETNALIYLNQLHADARKCAPVTVTGKGILDEIKNEWFIEYVGEGMRYANLKRWGDPMVRGQKQQTVAHIGSTYAPVTIPATDYRWTWEIPQNDLLNNSNLEPNWKNISGN